VRARVGMQATARKPSLLMIVHSLEEIVETARKIEQENYTVTVWCASISLRRQLSNMMMSAVHCVPRFSCWERTAHGEDAFTPLTVSGG
jgi:hypothetical protein